MLLEVNQINVYYGAIHALQGVSFNVNEGEIVTLIGANGAGKSTTLNTICGILQARTGSIKFKDRDITQISTEDIVGMGIAQSPEGRKIFAPLTVMENLEMGAYIRKDKQKIAEDLEWVFELLPRLKERRRQVGGTLSGGEQQMLATARALMTRPRLLLMDEPSMGLAPVLVETIFDTIERINKEGTTVLLVEQNALMALSVANRGYVLETGAIVMHDTGEVLKKNEKVQKAYLGME